MQVSNGWNALFPYLFNTLHAVECTSGYDIIGDKFFSPCVKVVYCPFNGYWFGYLFAKVFTQWHKW